MRQTIGGTWILGLVILFILLFVGFIVLTLNYSKSVKVKNEVISIIEKYEGLNDFSIELVNNYLESSGYAVRGGCEEASGVYGARDLNTSELEDARNNTDYYYCVKKYNGANTSKYYQVSIFYKFNLPIIGDTSSFVIKGTTSNFIAKDDADYRDVYGN